MTHSDTGRSGNGEEAPHANRLGDLEFKLAFLERELETWKDAVDGLHARLERSEARLREALRELRGQDGGAAGDQSSAAGSFESEADS
jgi:uncharacterized coiled-coil protein SlyX